VNQGAIESFPRYLQEIIRKALQIDPLLRFSSISEFRASLEGKGLILKSPPNQEYVTIFENTVNRYDEGDLEGEDSEDSNRDKTDWRKEIRRILILILILILVFLSGLVYIFLFGR
jgi:serine/threonine protein kinase